MCSTPIGSNSHWAILVLVICAVAVTETEAEAQAQEESSVFGTYRYVESHSHGRSIILEAFGKGIETAPAILRPLLRSRIERSKMMVSTFDISRVEENIVFRAISPISWTWDLRPGVAGEVDTPTGGRSSMVHSVRGLRYVQAFTGRTVSQRMQYTVSRGGRFMRVDTRVNIALLEEPVEFTLFYRRIDGGPPTFP